MLVPHFPGKPPSQAGVDVVSCLSKESRQATSTFATLTRQYQQYTLDCGCQAQEQQEGGHTQSIGCEYQQLFTQCFQPPNLYIQAQAQTQGLSNQQRSIEPLPPSQIFALEPSYGLDQPQMLPPQMQEQMAQLSQSHCRSSDESPNAHQYQHAAELWRKGSHLEDSAYNNHCLGQFQAYVGSGGTPISFELTSQGHHDQSQPGAFSYRVIHQRPSPQYTLSGQAFDTLSLQLQHYHHHKLPTRAPRKAQRAGSDDASSAAGKHGPSSAVEQPSMPALAARQNGTKQRFTSKDDALIVDLKETKNLTWRRIADFFPGRSSGTLQVRYCTKLSQGHLVDRRNGASKRCRRRIRGH